MPNGIIAQNKTFEDLFGLNSHESTASYNAEETIKLRYEKEKILEFEDLAEEEKNLTSIEKKDEGENPTISSEIKNVSAAENNSEKEADLPLVQVISGKMADGKNGKYVRYGK